MPKYVAPHRLDKPFAAVAEHQVQVPSGPVIFMFIESVKSVDVACLGKAAGAAPKDLLADCVLAAEGARMPPERSDSVGSVSVVQGQQPLHETLAW